jgi:hypothetical protein
MGYHALLVQCNIPITTNDLGPLRRKKATSSKASSARVRAWKMSMPFLASTTANAAGNLSGGKRPAPAPASPTALLPHASMASPSRSSPIKLRSSVALLGLAQQDNLVEAFGQSNEDALH